MSEPVLVAVAAGVQRITPNRPDKLNSFNPAMHALLRLANKHALAGRSGVYDMRVRNQKGDTIALFRGKSASIKGKFVESHRPVNV